MFPRTVGFWNFRCDLALEDGLALKGSRVVIPKAMRGQVLQAILLGHQEETKCILLARESVFWPGISNDIKQMVKGLPLVQPSPTRSTQTTHHATRPSNQTMGEAWD